MIRNFTLTNALGASFSLMNAQQGAFFEPQGLGFNDATQYEQVGEFFAPLTQRYGQQVITGSMVFGSQPYEHYLAFTKFCQHAPLSLVYETDAGTFQIPCRLTKIEKGDTDGWTYLNCKVEFTALARMYKTVAANNTGTVGGGKTYSEKELPDITGSIITIDNAEAGEVLNITADINPIQDLQGYDAPWVGGAGKNKLPISCESATKGGVTYTVYKNSSGAVTRIHAEGTSTSAHSFSVVQDRSASNPFTIKAGSYWFKGLSNGVTNSFDFNLRKKGESSDIVQITDKVPLVLTEDTEFQSCYMYVYRGGIAINADIYPMIWSQSESSDDFEPYSNICPISGHTEVDVVVSPTTDAEDGTTYTTQLGQTVYGGTLNLVSGVLTINYRCKTFTSSDTWFASSAGQNRYYFGETYSASNKAKPLGEGSSSHFYPFVKNASGSSVLSVDGSWAVYQGTNNYVEYYLRSTLFNSASDLNTYIAQQETAGTPVQMCYELATPTTIQLTPQQIQTLLGQNNVWANSGDITITGRKTYGYKYNYTYGDFVADTVTIDSDSTTSSPCRITIFGECTQPTWRHYLDGNSVATGYYNGTIPSGHKLVIDTTSSPYSIQEEDIAGNLIADRYELCDFSTERFFLLEYGHNTISVSHTDPDSIRLMVEGYIFYETV